MEKKHIITILVFIVILTAMAAISPKKVQDIVSDEQVEWEYNLEPMARDMYVAKNTASGSGAYVVRINKNKQTDLFFNLKDKVSIKTGTAPKVTKYTYTQEIIYKKFTGTSVIKKDLVKYVVSVPNDVFVDYKDIKDDMDKAGLQINEVSINDF